MIKRFLQKVFSKKTKATVAINQADSFDTSMAKKWTVKTHKIDKSLSPPTPRQKKSTAFFGAPVLLAAVFV